MSTPHKAATSSQYLSTLLYVIPRSSNGFGNNSKGMVVAATRNRREEKFEMGEATITREQRRDWHELNGYLPILSGGISTLRSFLLEKMITRFV